MEDVSVHNTTAVSDENPTSPGRGTPNAAKPGWDDSPDVPDSRAALVKDWTNTIKEAEKFWKKKAFNRMKTCQQLATHGAPQAWIDADSYVVPLIPRYINQCVSSLYAKDPRVIATRKKKLMYTVWDENPQSLAAAMQLAPMGDPQAQATLMDVQAVQLYNQMVDKLGKTLVVCWEHFCSQQATGFKEQMKALVRRAKVNGVAYVKVGFQRALEPRPEITAKINDVTSKIASIEAMMRQVAEGDKTDQDGELEQLRLSMRDLQDQEMMIVKEGPVFDWPRSDEIIPDTSVRHLKTFSGANWVAHKFDLTPKQVLEIYKIDLGQNYTRHYPTDTETGRVKTDNDKSVCRVYEVQDYKNQQVFTIIEGYPDFVKEPMEPEIHLERWWTVIPLIFNEVESDEDVYSPPDPWLIRHPQAEYNRSRQGLREHRVANRPKYITAAGSLEEDDLNKLENSPAHAVIEVEGMTTGEDINKKVARFQTIGIDPNMYQVEEVFKDTQRAVGSQESDFGGDNGPGTATDASISAHARAATLSDNSDALDDFLAELARAVGQVMMRELSKQTVLEIVGPGASWPEMRPTIDQVLKDLYLDVRAGSSGRPNAAAELAKIERAAPYLLQLPGINPRPLVTKYADLLDIDIDDLYTADLPSIMAQNAAAAAAAKGAPGSAPPGQPQVGTGNSQTDPGSQGAHGGNNQPSPQQNEPGPQPAFPAPGQATPHVA